MLRRDAPTDPTHPQTLATLGVVLGGVCLAAALGAWMGPTVGAILTLTVAAAGATYLMRRPVKVYPAGSRLPGPGAFADHSQVERQHAEWFIHMRWVAIVVSGALILVVVPIAHLLPARALLPLASWWTLLVAANVWFERWVSTGADHRRQIVVQGAVDLLILTGFLNASGGVENPVYFAYLFHAIIAAILLPRREAFFLTGLAALLFVAMIVGEYSHLLPHYTNRLFPHPGEALGGHSHGEGTVGHAAHVPFFVIGRAVPFLVLLFVAAYLTSLIAERLRRREGELEDAWRSLTLEHQRLERVVESTGVGMMLVDSHLELQWASDRAARWLHLPASSTPAACPLLTGPHACPECIARRTLESGEAEAGERRITTEGGGRRYFRHLTSPVLDADGRTIQVVELIEDVTDRKSLEAEAIHAAKLGALGTMAAGVAHEIGNPLSALATRLSLLERRPEPEFVAESVELLHGQIERIQRIVHGISLFARHQRQVWKPIDLNAVVLETLEVAQLHPDGRRVVFETRLASPSPRLHAVKDQIVQVVLNLLLNAAEANPPGEAVTVETAAVDDEVRIRVRDEGDGISARDRRRLFEPFFSTRPRGSGLGLSICQTLVHAHGGRIEVQSEPGAGSTFEVVLPRQPHRGRDAPGGER